MMKQSGSWKTSLFNTIFYRNGRYYFFNSCSSALFSLEKPAYSLIEKHLLEVNESGKCVNPGIEKLLAEYLFIRPAELNEYEIEHQKYLRTQRTGDRAFVSIVPTMACNLRCSYCFQKNFQHSAPMSNSVQESVISFVEKLTQRVKSLAVLWFGGEPLLVLSKIREMSETFQDLCAQKNVHYHAEMITNGMLLNKKSISTLSKLGLQRMEISIDGLPESYSERKEIPIKKAQEFYSFLFDNIGILLDAVNHLIIRINVDRDNIHEAKQIVDRIKKESDNIEYIDFRLQLLSEGKGLIECVPHNCYALSEASQIEMDFKRFLADEGLKVYGFPVRLNHPCLAVSKNAYTVDPEGKIGKCVPDTGNNGATFYSLNQHNAKNVISDLEQLDHPYADFDPFESKDCRYCPFLPVCLGQCPKFQKSDDFVCTRKEKIIAELPFYDRMDTSLLNI